MQKYFNGWFVTFIRIFLLLTVSGPSLASEPACLIAVQELALRAPELFPDQEADHLPSVKFSTRRQSSPLFGGEQWLMERHPNSRSWFSDSSSSKIGGLDVQGNPILFPAVFGLSVAKQLGFDAVGDGRMSWWVPDAKRFNSGIAKLNTKLPDPQKINLRFVEREKALLRTYLTDFANEEMLPFAPGGVHRAHDLAFHTSAIAAPPELMKVYRDQTKLLIHVTDRIVEHFKGKDLAEENAAKILRRAIFLQRAMAIDLFTAGFGVSVYRNENMDMELKQFVRLALSIDQQQLPEHLIPETFTSLDAIQGIRSFFDRAIGENVDAMTVEMQGVMHIHNYDTAILPLKAFYNIPELAVKFAREAHLPKHRLAESDYERFCLEASARIKLLQNLTF